MDEQDVESGVVAAIFTAIALLIASSLFLIHVVQLFQNLVEELFRRA